jgi:hypothetical protein
MVKRLVYCLKTSGHNFSLIAPQFKSSERLESMKNAVFWDMMPYGSVRTDVSEEPFASIIREKRMRELGSLAVTSFHSDDKGDTLLRNVGS